MINSPYILLNLCSLFWSLNFIIGKALAGAIPPATLSFLRWLLPFFFFLFYYRKDFSSCWPLLKKHWRLILLLGGTGYCLNSVAVYEAVNYTTTINTSFINAFNPVLIAITGFLFYRYPVTRLQSAGFMFSLLGVLFLIFKGHMGRVLELQINIGDLFMLAAISFWSIHTVVYKHRAELLQSRGVFPLMMLGGLLTTLPLALLESQASHWSWVEKIGIEQAVGILALNIFPSVLAYMFWNNALNKIPANKVAIFQYLIPVYTTIISLLFLDEQLRSFHVLGGGLIFVGVILVTNGESHGRPVSKDVTLKPDISK